MQNPVRIHHKTDGYLMIGLDGTARFLTMWEGFKWGWFKIKPKGVTEVLTHL